MFRKTACLVVMVCMAGMVAAQTKDKDKAKDATPAKETKAKLVAVDVKKGMLTVEIDGKKKDIPVEKDTKFVGPKDGKATIKDDRLAPGAMLLLTMDGGKLKQVRLPIRSKKPAAVKEKEKDKVKDK